MVDERIAKAIAESGGYLTTPGVLFHFVCACCGERYPARLFAGGVWVWLPPIARPVHVDVCKQCVAQYDRST